MRTADRADNNVNSWAQQSADGDAERDQQWEAADRENAGSQEDDLLQNELVVGRVPGRCPSCDLSPRLIWNLALSNLIAPFFRSPLLSAQWARVNWTRGVSLSGGLLVLQICKVSDFFNDKTNLISI